MNESSKPTGAASESAMPEILTLKEAAQLLGVKPVKVRQMIYGGQIRMLNLGKMIRIPRTEVERVRATIPATGQRQEPESITGSQTQQEPPETPGENGAKAMPSEAKRTRRHPRGTLERRPGVWYARWTDYDGRPRWKLAGSKEHAVALYHKMTAQKVAERALPELRARRSPVFAEIGKDCLIYCKNNHSHHGWQNDMGIMRRLFERFASTPVNRITPVEIEAFKNAMQTEGLTNSTINRHLALLSLAFKLAVRADKVQVNPVHQVNRLRENPSRTRFLSDEEELRFREAIMKLFPERLPEFVIAVHTGMRRGEQYGLRWEYVDFGRGMITISRSKNGETRYIPINAAAREAFLEVKQRNGNGETVFGIRSPRAWFEKACREAKLENLRWHDLRHTFGSRLTMKGVPIRAVQELMGHKTLAMTMRYSHLAPDYLKSAIEALTDGPKLYVRET